MLKRPLFSFFAICTALSLISASIYAYQSYQTTTASTQRATANAAEQAAWQQGSTAVDLDHYISQNQVSQNIIDKKQRVMLQPELIRFNAVLQTPVKASKAGLVGDALGVWGITPLPEVDFSTYIRSPKGEVLAVYVENAIADNITNFFEPEAPLQLQAYRLYNYAKGPRLLLVGIKSGTEDAAVTTEKVATDE
ncbi:MAG: hypothetical protein HRU23_19820 [Gammaproteobacteria bacterium]|nr:hypothetical protein [Gammaproteobacteria bacterium]